LMLSQLLTLYTTPVIYLAFDRVAKRLMHRRTRKELHDGEDLVPAEH